MCLVCQQRRGRAPTIEIDHPPGEEIQWDWLELTTRRGASRRSCSSARCRTRGASGRVLRADDLRAPRRRAARGARRPRRHAAGLADRSDGHDVIPGTDRLTIRSSAQAGQALRRRGRVCPPRRRAAQGRRRGRDQVHRRSRWWRTARVSTMPRRRRRWTPGASRSPTARAGAGGRSASSAPPSRCARCRRLAYPAEIVVERKASRSALVAFEGNRYSVPPATPAGRSRSAPASASRVCGSSPRPASWSPTHRRAPPAPARRSAPREHAALLEQAVLAAFTTRPACRRKTNRPPGQDALAELARLRGLDPEPAPVIGLAPLRRARGGRVLMADTHLPAAARAPRLPAPARGRRAARPGAGGRRARQARLHRSSCTTCSPPKSTPSSNAASKAACGSPSSPPARRSSSSTSPPNPRWTAAWSKTSPRCASSRRRPT